MGVVTDYEGSVEPGVVTLSAGSVVPGSEGSVGLSAGGVGVMGSEGSVSGGTITSTASPI